MNYKDKIRKEQDILGNLIDDLPNNIYTYTRVGRKEQLEENNQKVNVIKSLELVKQDNNMISKIIKGKENFIVGYIRAGRIDDTKRSIVNQKKIIEQFCEENNVRYKEIFIDEGFSGENINRPGVQKMLNTKEIRVILTKDFSRITRNMIDFQELLNGTDKIIISILDNLVIYRR